MPASLDLDDTELAALVALLRAQIESTRWPLAPRIEKLRSILDKVLRSPHPRGSRSRRVPQTPPPISEAVPSRCWFAHQPSIHGSVAQNLGVFPGSKAPPVAVQKEQRCVEILRLAPEFPI
jgi:hypothetical protein